MNPLAEHPRVRKVVYTIFWTVSLVLSSTQVGVAAIPGATNPQWLVVGLAVLPFVGTAIGFAAAQNTPAAVRPRQRIMAVIKPKPPQE